MRALSLSTACSARRHDNQAVRTGPKHRVRLVLQRHALHQRGLAVAAVAHHAQRDVRHGRAGLQTQVEEVGAQLGPVLGHGHGNGAEGSAADLQRREGVKVSRVRHQLPREGTERIVGHIERLERGMVLRQHEREERATQPAPARHLQRSGEGCDAHIGELAVIESDGLDQRQALHTTRAHDPQQT